MRKKNNKYLTVCETTDIHTFAISEQSYLFGFLLADKNMYNYS